MITGEIKNRINTIWDAFWMVYIGRLGKYIDNIHGVFMYDDATTLYKYFFDWQVQTCRLTCVND